MGIGKQISVPQIYLLQTGKNWGTRGTFPAGNQGYQDKTACVLGRKNNSRNHHHLKWIWTTQISIVAESFRISTSGPDSEVL